MLRIKSFISVLQKSITFYVNLDFLKAQYTLIMLCSYVFSRISSPQSTLFLVSALCWRLMQQFLNTLDHSMAAFPLGGCHRGHSHSYQGYKIAIPSHMADMVATQSHNNHIEASFGKIALSDENYKCFSNSLF